MRKRTTGISPRRRAKAQRRVCPVKEGGQEKIVNGGPGKPNELHIECRATEQDGGIKRVGWKEKKNTWLWKKSQIGEKEKRERMKKVVAKKRVYGRDLTNKTVTRTRGRDNIQEETL